MKTLIAHSVTTQADLTRRKKIRIGLAKIKELKNTKSVQRQVGGKNSGSLIAPTSTAC